MTNKILVIRKDNLGDMICTTPMISALRAAFPESYLAVLGNSYNAPLLHHHPDIQRVFSYTKAKHRSPSEGLFGVLAKRLALLLKLRHKRFDTVILAGANFSKYAYRTASFIRPARIVGYADKELKYLSRLGLPPIRDDMEHEVVKTFRLLEPLGITGSPPPLKIGLSPLEKQWARQRWHEEKAEAPGMRIAIQISTRKLSQQWPIKRFGQLMQRLHTLTGASFALFWAPGDASNPHHPGDDGKAKELLKETAGIPVLPFAAKTVRQLLAGLSTCDYAIHSEGGAAHFAAAMGLPSLCFYGEALREQWHPWGVPYVILQPHSRIVSDLSVPDAMEGFVRLLAKAPFAEGGPRLAPLSTVP